MPAFLKLTATTLRTIQLLAVIVALATYSTYLARLHTRHFGTSRSEKAVEAISGIGVAYLLCAVLFTCILGGKRLFAFVAILLDILFCGAFVAVAGITGPKGGTSKCYFKNGTTTTQLTGKGNSTRVVVVTPKQLRTDCHLVKATFAVAVILALTFLISAALQFLLMKKDQEEPRHSSGRRFRMPFGRKKHVDTFDAEMATRH